MINGLTLLGIVVMVSLLSWAFGRYLAAKDVRKMLYCPKHNEPWIGINSQGERFCGDHYKRKESWAVYDCPQPRDV